eukprot:c29329_g1_i3 orf=116-487(+)
MILVPKKRNPIEFRDWRPLTMLTIAYKVLAKVLARRLGGVIHKLVDKEQKGFVVRRSMLDQVANIREAIQWAVSEKRDTLFTKIDFDKAYDRVEWVFIDRTLEKLGIGPGFRRWTHILLKGAY